MKELELVRSDIEMIVQAQAQKEYKKIGTIVRKIDGGRVYAIDCETMEVKEAEIRGGETYRINTERGPAHPLAQMLGISQSLWTHEPEVIDVEPGKIYVEAINRKNAIRRLKKQKILFRT
jgi:hypothetical protein